MQRVEEENSLSIELCHGILPRIRRYSTRERIRSNIEGLQHTFFMLTFSRTNLMKLDIESNPSAEKKINHLFFTLTHTNIQYRTADTSIERERRREKKSKRLKLTTSANIKARTRSPISLEISEPKWYNVLRNLFNLLICFVDEKEEERFSLLIMVLEPSMRGIVSFESVGIDDLKKERWNNIGSTRNRLTHLFSLDNMVFDLRQRRRLTYACIS